MAKTDRKLDYLPDQGVSDIEYRDWLTTAVGCPSGLRFESFTRHGSQLQDACTFTISVPGGETMSFRSIQQRLASPSSVRAEIAYASHGLLRPAHLSRGELEDIWIAMLTLSNIVDSQTEADETWSWLTRYQAECDPVTGLTFTRDGRFDALAALQRRPVWGRVQASDREQCPPGRRPSWVVDDVTGEQYVRVSELLAFVRYSVGATPMGAAALTARMHEIGAKRMFYETRRGDLHPRMTLYLLPAESSDGVPEAER